MSPSRKKKPETSAALDRIGLASIAEYVRELRRRRAEGGGK